jgi:hypothetical protein
MVVVFGGQKILYKRTLLLFRIISTVSLSDACTRIYNLGLQEFVIGMTSTYESYKDGDIF